MEISMDKFITVYREELEKAIREHPEEYRYGVSFVPKVVERITKAIKERTVSKDGRAFKATCDRLGIKYTYTAIYHFIAT